ncbi:MULTISPECIES: sensor histidine kinase [Kitasatospora]|uniref:histidine kinase n=1 Tax=Kitasatospora setae (strain ATCC 33774 / DSM 43861 / JCM 3304 / KCC A-0304 / NBRC 14216 / KM-6054) TaxID=452652 RepID=E4N123_KITSK|nr:MULTISPECIES: sensor histidine kinase [Kitasatospora]BAJ31857.1 putative two-component system sensor kinase [Kitasatospora setae KM-6054]
MGVAVWAAMRRPGRFLVSWWPWRAWALLVSGAGQGVLVLAGLAVGLAVGVGLSVFGVGVLVLGWTALIGIPVGAVERGRLRLVEPERLPDPHHGAARGLRGRLRERASWRELGYALAQSTVFAAVGLLFAAALAFCLLLVSAPLFILAVSPDTVMLWPGRPVSGPLDGLPASAAGLLGLVVLAYSGGLLAGAQVRLAQQLLGPRDTDLGVRVIELTRSRARLADAFEAERRRIERDLHDGAQQQLVALGMTLGLAELELAELVRRGHDTPATALVARARGEARLALEQLRTLVRGIHPQVLTDHGLPAAVAELAARHPVPVLVELELPHRLPEQVESAAYFTITEALTNAAKHADADEITVRGGHRAGALRLSVTDNGRGGADPRAGAGLQGLADRLAVLDGRLTVTSPPGGPTRLDLEVPC